MAWLTAPVTDHATDHVSDLVVRRAGEADALAVAALRLQSDRERGAGPEPGFLDRFAAAWTGELSRRPTWLAEDEGRPVGVLVLLVTDELPRVGGGRERWAEVSLLFVSAGFRGAGIGCRLLEEMLGWARSNGVGGVRVSADAASAPRWERAGFAAAAEPTMERRL